MDDMNSSGEMPPPFLNETVNARFLDEQGLGVSNDLLTDFTYSFIQLFNITPHLFLLIFYSFSKTHINIERSHENVLMERTIHIRFRFDFQKYFFC